MVEMFINMYRLSISFGIVLTTILGIVVSESPLPIESEIENLSAYPKYGVSYRLPNSSRPLTYDIALNWTDDVSFKFDGRTKIEIVILEYTETVVIHKRFIDIDSIIVTSPDYGDQEFPIVWTYSNITDFLTISFDKYLYNGLRLLLDISYNGQLRNDKRGFFYDSYLSETGERRILATTHFQPSNARHAFPCYDEPQIKANFSISISYKSKYTAISNMPEIETINSTDEIKTTKFQTTPPTSSYLIAFAVSDYAMLEGKSNSTDEFSKTLVRVFSQPKRIADTKLVLDSGINLISEIGRYVGIPFTLDKIDQIAVPSFGGAMENWGIVVYGESLFFWNNKSDYTLKEGIMRIVSHEFAHQWFGNLVSPDWWEFIWLNEGFADYFGYKGIDLVDPSMGMMEIYLADNVHVILNVDGEQNIRPMSHYVEDPQSVSALFDRIAYGKSGSVIRMFSHAFGEQTFVSGLNKYLKSRSFNSATEEDLFDAISEAVKENNQHDPQLNVGNVMRSWTRQSGFPLLSVVRDYKSGEIILTQDRYFNNASLHGTSDSIWWIPLNFITSNTSIDNVSETIADYWLGSKSAVIHQTKIRQWNSNDWVFFNKNATGYYRVMYDEKNYELLADALKNGQANSIDSLGRSQLINDAFNYAQNGRFTYESVLNLMQFMKDETTYAPWSATLEVLIYLDSKLAGTDQYALFEKFQRNMIDKLYKTVGITDIQNESHLNKYLRTFAIKIACSKGHSLCRIETTKILKKLLDEGGDFHQNYRSLLSCESVRGAKRSEYNRLWMRLADPTNKDSNYRFQLIHSLSCVDSKSLLSDYLKSALDSTNDKFIIYNSLEQFFVLSAVYSSGQTGLKLTIDFLRKNIDEAYQKYGIFLTGILGGISNNVNSKQVRKEFDKLIKVIGDKDYISESNLQSYVRNTERNFEWQAPHLKGINSWLKANV